MIKDRFSEIGKIREINKSTILNAAGLIKKGKIFDLGMEINENLPGREQGMFPFNIIFESTPEDIKKHLKNLDKTSKVSASNEIMISSTHTSTHIDALCHFHLDDKLFGNFNVKDSRNTKGWKKCGAETIPPIAGRGILIDIAKYLNRERICENYVISLDDVRNYLDDKNINIKFGDTVCVRTGKIIELYNKDYLNQGPGISVEAAKWLYEQGMCVLSLDYNSVDGNPFKNFNDSTHTQMLIKSGVYLIENIYLEELSECGVLEFFIMCSSPKFTGFSGSWVRPIAII